MYRNFYKYWILIPLLLLAIFAREWVETPSMEELEETIDMARTQADYYLEEFETRKLDASGNPAYVVVGDTLTHYPADDSSEIESPNLTLHREGAVWSMQSARGRLTTNPDVFTLHGPVLMERQATSEIDAIVIRTSDLKIHTVDNFVETEKFIEVNSATWTLRSTGFESHIDKGILTLLSRVEGHYEIDQ